MAECFIYRTINTNADKIRAMSDEELAKVMERMLGCPVTGDCKKIVMIAGSSSQRRRKEHEEVFLLWKK